MISTATIACIAGLFINQCQHPFTSARNIYYIASAEREIASDNRKIQKSSFEVQAASGKNRIKRNKSQQR